MSLLRIALAAGLVLLCALTTPLAGAIQVGGGDLNDGRSTATGGLVATEGWDGSEGNNGFEIDWIISDMGGGNWSFSYTISGVNDADLSKGLSHWVLQISEDNTNLSAFSNFLPREPNDGPKLFDNQVDGNSNPFLPTPPGIWGIKWETEDADEESTFTVSFESTREPVWGHFYAVDGKKEGYEVYAYNAGLENNQLPDANTTVFTDWVAAPNGLEKSVIPEPASIIVWFLLGAIGVGRRRWRK